MNDRHPDLVQRTTEALERLGVDASRLGSAAGREVPASDGGISTAELLISGSPITGGELARVPAVSCRETADVIGAADDAFATWRNTPAPIRGQLVKRLGELITEHLDDLAWLVTVEAGKIGSEARGEVQEMIDICDFALGLSRQLYGRTFGSERPGHRLQESWHPRGVVGVISAFNFPVAVWSWNTAIALVCGDTVVWKPSEMTPLCSLGCAALLDRACTEMGHDPRIHQVLLGGRGVGEQLAADDRVAVLSATGSTRMGAEVAPIVAARFGQCLLELGGNNAAIVTQHADLDIAVPAVVFGAAGTAGQRCTTNRRLLVHESIADEVVGRIATAYRSLQVGDPSTEGVLVGPLINAAAAEQMAAALDRARADGGEVIVGGDSVDVAGCSGGVYVHPAVVRMPEQTAIVESETFAPILYVMAYHDLDEALALHNAVPQGLSGGIFTNDVLEAERYLATADTGIANVNAGTSGAEIGGAFGGEKATGGGRESGSDAWKAYMRRSTTTINFSGATALAQGVEFG